MQKYNHILYSFVLAIAFMSIDFQCVMAQCLIDEEFVLTGEDTQAGDYFGYSVDTDANRVVIGAYLDDDNGSNSGSVNVFHIVDGNWVREEKLLASDGKANDWLGWSVAISGETIVAGANRDNNAGDWTGSVYVFKYDGTKWIETQKLIADGTGYYWEEFGFDVAISADSNTILVGACKANDNGYKSGAAYIFRFDGSSWFQQTKLLASDGAELATFGNGVAISEDGNTALIGAPGNDSNGRTAGSVYVFKYEGENWIEKYKLVAHDATHGDHFGQNLAVFGNIAVVGAYGDDNSEPNNVYCNSGSAYIFKFDGKGWIEQAKLQLPTGKCLNQFGWDMDVFGNKVVIGAPDGHWGVTNGPGHAYLYTFNGKRWLLKSELNSGDIEFGDHFGWSVAISDNTIIVGSELSDKKGNDSGTVYSFDIDLIPSDFDCNREVDYIDFYILASVWLSSYGDWAWNPACDISVPADDIIDILDIIVFADYWLTNKNK